MIVLIFLFCRCRYEILLTVKAKKKVTILFGESHYQAGGFLSDATKNPEEVRAALNAIDAARAGASRPEDQEQIFAAIEKLLPHGVQDINEIVHEQLDEWIYSTIKQCTPTDYSLFQTVDFLRKREAERGQTGHEKSLVALEAEALDAWRATLNSTSSSSDLTESLTTIACICKLRGQQGGSQIAKALATEAAKAYQRVRENTKGTWWKGKFELDLAQKGAFYPVIAELLWRPRVVFIPWSDPEKYLDATGEFDLVDLVAAVELQPGLNT